MKSKCILIFVKYIINFGKGIWYNQLAWYVADAKSVWSWRKLLTAVQCFYIDSTACVRMGNDMSEWFPVNIGLNQGCVMSSWLFSVYMDGVVREVNVRVLGKGLELLSANGGRFDITLLVICR